MNAVVEHQPEASAYDRLSRREKRFVDKYVPGLTGAEAMRSIGYKGAQPERMAWRWLQRPEIQAAIEEREQHYIREMGAGFSGFIDVPSRRSLAAVLACQLSAVHPHRCAIRARGYRARAS